MCGFANKKGVNKKLIILICSFFPFFSPRLSTMSLAPLRNLHQPSFVAAVAVSRFMLRHYR
jgi:hypothetical protein